MAGGEYDPLPAGARRITEHLPRPHPCKREDFLVRWKKRKKGGFPMRLLLKILFAPVMLALILVVHFAAFLLSVSAGIFALAGTVFAILAAIIFFAVNHTNGIIVLIFAFLISPFGLPMLAAWLIGKLQDLRYALQDWLY